MLSIAGGQWRPIPGLVSGCFFLCWLMLTNHVKVQQAILPGRENTGPASLKHGKPDTGLTV